LRKSSEIEAGNAIVLEGISKSFYYSTHSVSSVRDWFIRKVMNRPQPSRYEFFRMSDINLRIRQGESVALLGDNGSGKSSLLRIIAGIYYPSSGYVECNGRLATVLELGSGFHPQLSGLENIGISASVMGIGREEIGEARSNILAFAGLGDSIRIPLKYYSTGMRARLAFAIAVAIEPDVLLLDEVLAVGDQAFQKKCLKRIRQIQESGTTLVYVSHNMQSAANLCSRAVLLEKGRIVEDGPTPQVLKTYENLS